MWWMIAASIVSTGVVLFLLGRRNERAVQRDWEFLLTRRGQRLFERVETKVQSDLTLAGSVYDKAFEVRELGSVDDAIRLLDAGYRIIAEFSPSMLRLLAAMATFSRMVSAMAPVRPLRPLSFKLTEIVNLAYLNGLLHQFLVSAGERFRLRLFVLGRCFGVATRYLLRATKRIAHREGESEREWDQIEAIRYDFQTLTDESLASLRLLLMSLDATSSEDLLRRIS